ncbi:HEAT repeat domain-containing protein, partial [Methanoculleus bourgensis]|uniref:HEAT repeat domain-containing protein n=1 Tax=Methanoculleus bourgensis TaxID=83986 RepID=UPI003B94F121
MQREGNPAEERRFNIDLLRAEENIDGLIAALESEDGLTRQRAALALGDFGDAKAVAPLIRALGDPLTAVREAAADSLAMLGPPAVEPLVELIERPGASERYEEPGAAESAKTVTGPGDLSWEIATRRDLRRVYAAAILGEIGDPSAVEPLARALRDANNDVRCQASGALAKFGRGAVELLTTVLADPDPDVRVVAAGVLGDIGDASVVEPLIGALRDANDDVRGAAGALKYIGDPRAIDALQDLTRDEDADVRSVAEDAIA